VLQSTAKLFKESELEFLLKNAELRGEKGSPVWKGK
jgi:hypothetical protein